MGAIVTSAFTWPVFDSLDPSTSLTPAIAIWYCSLVFAVTAITCATQQAVALGRLNCYYDRLDRLRRMLGRLQDGEWELKKWQIYIWQTPVMVLNGSIYMFILGLALLIW
jgi:hypothetical protein